MSNWLTSESDGRFFAARSPGGCYRFERDGGDMGRGEYSTTHVFYSSEARQHFIRAEEAEDRARIEANKVEALQCRISRLLTRSGRVRRKLVINLVNQVRGDGYTTARSKDSGVSSEKGTEATNPLA